MLVGPTTDLRVLGAAGGEWYLSLLGTQTLANCQAGRVVKVDMTYDQPLYLPLISNVFETKPNGTRTLTASAQATCEQ